MAKVQICDHCGKIVKDLHRGYFREYYIGCDFDFDLGLCFPTKRSKTQKIEICKDCWSKLIKPEETEAKDDE